MLKQFPRLKTDKEAEGFVETADLSQFDFSGFKPQHFEFQTKTASLNMRLPESLLSAVKERAGALGVPYSRFVRRALEEALSAAPKPSAEISDQTKSNKAG